MMYLVIIHAGIKVTINQHWVGSGNYNKTPPNRWWRYIMSYSTIFKTPGCFCFIPLCAQVLYLPFLAYTCTLYVSIDVYIYMSVYRKVFSLHTPSHSVTLSELTCLIFQVLAGFHSMSTWFCNIMTCWQGFALSKLYLPTVHQLQGCCMVRYLFPTILKKTLIALDTVLAIRH